MGPIHEKLSKKLVIINELGLHARSAAMIANLARQAKSKGCITKEGSTANAASILDILTLVCEKGTQIDITIEDRTDMDILEGIEKLVKMGFEE